MLFDVCQFFAFGHFQSFDELDKLAVFGPSELPQFLQKLLAVVALDEEVKLLDVFNVLFLLQNPVLVGVLDLALLAQRLVPSADHHNLAVPQPVL